MWRVGLLWLVLLAGCAAPQPEEAVSEESTSPPPLPQIFLWTAQELQFDHKQPCTISIVENGDTVLHQSPSKAKFRGGFTRSFPKHSFTVKLGTKIKVAGLQKNDDWILLSSHNDKSFLRHAFAYDYFRAMRETNVAPHCAYAELFYNGTYHGIYIVTEKMGKKRLNINREDSVAFIFKDPPVFRDPKYPDIDNGQPAHNWFHQKYPDPDQFNKNHLLYDLRDFIHHSDDAAFADESSGIPAIFDLEDLIDWHLLLLITNNGDGVFKNFYLYRTDASSGYRLCPWDYDNTLARDGDNEPNPHKVDLNKSALLRRLLETNAAGYKDRFKARYEVLKTKGLLTSDYMRTYIEQQANQLRPHLAKNNALWPLDAPYYFDTMSNEEDWKLIQDWWDVHLIYLDEYMISL